VFAVYPRRGISDPEGETLLERLNRKGMTNIDTIRSGKYWEVHLEATSKEEALSYVQRLSQNPPVMNPIKDGSKIIALEEVE
jgi:phosphoribosylformylglycinamidine (FGAM) synthase PurS component